MTIERFRKAQRAQPFCPCTLTLASGRAIPVLSPGFVPESHTGRTISVATADDAFDIVDLLLVEGIEVGNGRWRGRAR